MRRTVLMAEQLRDSYPFEVNVPVGDDYEEDFVPREDPKYEVMIAWLEARFYSFKYFDRIDLLLTPEEWTRQTGMIPYNKQGKQNLMCYGHYFHFQDKQAAALFKLTFS